ncbi:MAG TPA: ABC transporter ATP-binding protein, partial [Candidatus Krumholzibacteria bacterium]|nr:ABC transporter ATP-binding protein [Candidatus Krumholzibacteria bacterium]
LELHSIHKSYRRGFWGVRTPILKGVDLAIERGELFGFLGHNGAGKSTTMKIILGLLRPDQGHTMIFEERGSSSRARARIGYLGEEVGLYPNLNATETLVLAAELFRIPRKIARSRAAALIEQVGLEHAGDRKTKQYSKGMRQRLGLATALINDPELLILDEPYSGLDPIGRRQLRELLLALKAQGKTIMMSSHIVPDVEAVCDRVGILADGVIARVLDLNAARAQNSGEVEVVIGGDEARRMVAREFNERQIHANDSICIVRCAGDQRLRALIDAVYTAGGRVLEVKPLRSGLEDIFVDVVGSRTGQKNTITTATNSTVLEPELSRR